MRAAQRQLHRLQRSAFHVQTRFARLRLEERDTQGTTGHRLAIGATLRALIGARCRRWRRRTAMSGVRLGVLERRRALGGVTRERGRSD